MPEEPGAPRPRRIAPEIWAGIVIMVVCLGAYVGPKLYVHFQRERVVERLTEPLSSRLISGQDVENALGADVVVELMSKCWPEADAALRRYANLSDQTAAYVCGANGRMFVCLHWSRVPVSGDGARGKHISGIEECCIQYYMVDGGQAGVMPGLEAVKIKSCGENLQVAFRLRDDVAAAMGVPGGKEWAVWLEVVEVKELVREFSEPFAVTASEPLTSKCVRYLLRKAGALPEAGKRAPAGAAPATRNGG